MLVTSSTERQLYKTLNKQLLDVIVGELKGNRMDKSGIHTTVTKYPDCDMCKIDFRLPDIKINAYYDAPTVYGSWAYMCRTCYLKYRMHDKLGVRFGQQLLLER